MGGNKEEKNEENEKEEDANTERELVYKAFLTTNDLFLENPEFYINSSNGPLDSPPMRLCILGPRGCGKTTQAKRIAEDNNAFHVSFRDLVQEQLLQITQGPKVGNEFNEWNRLLEEKELCEEENLQKSLDQIVYPVPEDEPE